MLPPSDLSNPEAAKADADSGARPALKLGFLVDSTGLSEDFAAPAPNVKAGLFASLGRVDDVEVLSFFAAPNAIVEEPKLKLGLVAVASASSLLVAEAPLAPIAKAGFTAASPAEKPKFEAFLVSGPTSSPSLPRFFRDPVVSSEPAESVAPNAKPLVVDPLPGGLGPGSECRPELSGGLGCAAETVKGNIGKSATTARLGGLILIVATRLMNQS